MDLPPDVASSAAVLIRTHGVRAEQECRHMIGRLTRRGDAQGLAIWHAILSAVEAAKGGA
jgi:hypothetical protein